jgi:CRISPR-associated endonuclease/helicase Cas3
MFRELFTHATCGSEPYPYQERLATVGDALPVLLDVPTGLGKTAAVLLAWIWRRRFAADSVRSQTPRRLVYCLPMRVLVEQTFTESVRWLDRLGLLAGTATWTERDDSALPTKNAQLVQAGNGDARGYRPSPEAEAASDWAVHNGDRGQHAIAVHLLMGGEDRSDWALWPERDSVLIGTQDMLLSRALNRGYAAGRARWPMEFGLLNNDSLWVFDEVQLMSTGLATGLQLDAWRMGLRLRGSRAEFFRDVEDPVFRPCRSLWMSATMAKHWLNSAVDWSKQVEPAWNQHRVVLGEHELSDGMKDDFQERRVKDLWAITKRLEDQQQPVATLEKPKTKEGRADKGDAEAEQFKYVRALSKAIGEKRSTHGLTLVILNTVDRAVDLYSQLEAVFETPAPSVHLIHSRFRPYEREKWQQLFQTTDEGARIIISTQVVEAGVDMSAEVLFTELAPWAALVQRFGRCARYPGGMGHVHWMNLDLGSPKQPVDHWAKPYDATELGEARQKLQELNDVGLKNLDEAKHALDQDAKGAARLFPYEPRFVPRDKDLFDLFDTTPDLTGADVDISRFIRDDEELDVQVFWRDVPLGQVPAKKDKPDRRELCPVAFYRFKDQIAALCKHGRVWHWSYRSGWSLLGPNQKELIYPGQVFLLEKSCGGYDQVRGWTGYPGDQDFDVVPARQRCDPSREGDQDAEDDGDPLSELDNKWFSILGHTSDVCRTLDEVLRHVGITGREAKLLKLAARLHDWGKAHAAFQAKLDAETLGSADVQEQLNSQPAAKAPDAAWRRDKLKAGDADDKRRPGFRHELASALAVLELLRGVDPGHLALAWPDLELRRQFADAEPIEAGPPVNEGLASEIALLSQDDFDLLLYLVAAHHGKVRMSLRSSPDDGRSDVPDPCPAEVRQARSVRDGDVLPGCLLPSIGLDDAVEVPSVTLHLDSMELGLSAAYGPSWRERMQNLLEQLGPFRLAYLESLLRAADCRASRDEEAKAVDVAAEART